MVASIGFSAFLALSLTPALCAHAAASRSRPATTHDKRGFFGWFNRNFDKATTHGYEGWVATIAAPRRRASC